VARILAVFFVAPEVILDFYQANSIYQSRLSSFMPGAVLVQMGYHSMEIMDRMDVF